MKRLFPLLAALLLTAAPAAAQRSDAADTTAPADTTTLTVDAVVRRVLDTYPTVEAARQAAAAADARVQQARSAYLPIVSGMGTYRRQDPVPSFTLPGGPEGGGRAVSIQPHNNYDAHLALSQTLYDFGRTANQVDVAKAGRQVATERIGQVQSGLALRAVQSFYAVLLLQETLRVQDQQVEQLEQALAVTRRQREAGTATDFEVLSTQTRISAAQSQRIDLARQQANQKAALRQLLGLPGGAPLALSGDFRPAPAALDGEQLAAEALARRPEVRVAQAQARQAGVRVDAARSADNPALALSAQGGYKNGYPGTLDELRANESIEVSLRVPLFDGLRTRRQIDEAEANARAAEAQLDDTERRVVTDVAQAEQNVQATRARLSTSDLRVQQAEQALDLAQRRYRAGTITNLDLLDAVTTRAEARLGNAQALYDILTAQYTLRQATGTLLDDFLQ